MPADRRLDPGPPGQSARSSLLSRAAARDLLETIAAGSIRLWCRRTVRRSLILRIEGQRHIPPRGPVLIVCRHYHHLYDGCALLAALPRFVHILVALDWVEGQWLRASVERACRLAHWPVVLRGERLRDHAASAYGPQERRRYLRSALRESVALLHQGGVLAIFPEAYPTIDPSYTPKTRDDHFLPFRGGFAGLVEQAQRDGRTRVAILPAGLDYRRGAKQAVTLRFGAPIYAAGRRDRDELVRAVEGQVRRLSGL